MWSFWWLKGGKNERVYFQRCKLTLLADVTGRRRCTKSHHTPSAPHYQIPAVMAGHEVSLRSLIQIKMPSSLIRDQFVPADFSLQVSSFFCTLSGVFFLFFYLSSTLNLVFFLVLLSNCSLS
ncbi:hypothetical protein XENORESO_009218 [Xenotaenia resolanae]|uniref:Uncharacterized protein n=1 Tax=Xenotaenia resolanae TaxID=208358 RepID=A0ABV0WQW8_9TELE